MASLTKILAGTLLCRKNNSYAFSVSIPSKHNRYSNLASPNQLSIPTCSQSSLWGQKKLNAGKMREAAKPLKLFCGNDNAGPFETAPEMLPPYSVSDLIQDFCGAINAKDVRKLNLLLAEDSLFMDLIFYMPFGGKQNIINFLCDVMDAMGPNVHFAIDTLTEQEKFTATLTWHLQWKDKEIPFTTGCTFFECKQSRGKLLIRRIIGLEELPVKPGELVLKLLKATSSTFDNFPMAAEGLLQKVQGNGGGLQMLLDILTSKRNRKP